MTALLYAASAAGVLYEFSEYAVWSWVRNLRSLPWDLPGWEFWFYEKNIAFVLAMLTAIVVYRWRAGVQLGASQRRPVRSVIFGICGGLVAIAVLAPLVCFHGWYSGQMQFMQLLIFHAAISGYGKVVIVLFVLGLAICSEWVFRGIVFRTFSDYASTPSSLITSTLLFAVFNPFLGLFAGLIVGVVCAFLYYKTRHLLAPTIASIVFLGGGGALSTWCNLMGRH